jgi:hypothetical protein
MPARFSYASERPRRWTHVAPGTRTKLLGHLAGRSCYLVDGEMLRNNVDIDFTQGGNGARYGYVPRAELWVDECLGEGDRWPTLLHELIEDHLMILGRSYEDAHEEASAFEMSFRDEGKVGFEAVRRFFVENIGFHPRRGD